LDSALSRECFGSSAWSSEILVYLVPLAVAAKELARRVRELPISLRAELPRGVREPRGTVQRLKNPPADELPRREPVRGGAMRKTGTGLGSDGAMLKSAAALNNAHWQARECWETNNRLFQDSDSRDTTISASFNPFLT
jgi:hypothetical protein